MQRAEYELLYYQNKVVYSLPVTAIRSKIYKFKEMFYMF